MMSNREQLASSSFLTQRKQPRQHAVSSLSLALLDKPKWMQEAMGIDNDDDDDEKTSRLSRILPLAAGLSGFAIDPQLGFCAILAEPSTTTVATATTTTTATAKNQLPFSRRSETKTSATKNDTFSTIPPKNQQQQQQQPQRCLYVVVSPQDKTRLQSAEALTLVQLAGGLDLGTPIVPPDALAKIVAEQLEDDWDMESSPSLSLSSSSPFFPVSSEDLRKRITLLRVEAVPVVHPTSSTTGSTTNEKDDDITSTMTTTRTATTTATMESSSSMEGQTQKDRTKAILISAPRVLRAIQGLPGLGDTTVSQLEQAMERHANDVGTLDRLGFSEVLDDLRRGGPASSSSGGGTNQNNRSNIQLMLWVVLAPPPSPPRSDADAERSTTIATPSILKVEAPSILLGLALAMRYKVPLTVDDSCFFRWETKNDNYLTATEILDKFPAFRPIRELYEDAKVMDAFIPGMVKQAKELDNEDKL
jgi:hypothetical protein